jgi:hypothetical protein
MEEPDYLSVANKCLEQSLRESWMDDDDWEEILHETLKVSGNTLQSFADDLKKGVENGVSIETQLELVKIICKRFTNNNE